jgi:peptide/nickel transport system ATP-binding protein
MSAQPVLDVRDLSVTFAAGGRSVCAVDNLSYQLGEAETVTMVGESGCGKSVSALALVGLLPATARVTGTARLAGEDLLGVGERRLNDIRGRDIAVVFQDSMSSLNPVLSVGRQIGEVLRRHQGLSRGAATRRSRELLDMVEIPAAERRLREYPHQLSGGMRQRVAIAMALACTPKVLIADEPTTALDVTVQAGILDLLRSLRDELGMSMLLITHDLGVVADSADRVVVMYAGRPVESAAVHELFRSPAHPYTSGLLGAAPSPAARTSPTGLAEIPGTVPTLASPARLCSFAPRCTARGRRCDADRPDLQAVADAHHAACWYPVSAPSDHHAEELS